MLDGLVSYAGTVYQPDDEFAVIAEPGDFTVLLIGSLISPTSPRVAQTSVTSLPAAINAARVPVT